MNNLKKVLALGLALIMLMGMFTVVSAAETKMVASDLTDWDSVVHQDAVSLMVDLGIIKGKDTGAFDPTGNIDRASWAKMVYYAATGTEDADAYLGTGSGLGDIAGNWAEAYINYLYANKLISGDNLGNYNPSANVTVAEACKMMLTTLGYDANDREYQGTSAWAGNVIKDANRNGLLTNVDKNMTALTPLTRENAAEIVLNTLNANMVTIENGRDNGEHYVVKYEYTQTLGYDVFNMIKVVAAVKGVDDNSTASFYQITSPAVWAGRTLPSGKVLATPKMLGEDVNIYIETENTKWSKDTGEMSNAGDFKGFLCSTAAPAGTTPVKTFTAGISRWDDLTKRGSTYYVADNFAMKEGTRTTAWYKNGSASSESEVQKAAAKRGTVVDFYTNEDGDISVVKAYEYTVGLVDNGDATTKTLNDGTVQVRIPGVLSNWVDSDKITGWQGLVEGDVVLYYESQLEGDAKAYTFEKTEKVTGKVTGGGNSKGELTINGTRYRASEQTMTKAPGDEACTEADFKAWTNVEDEFDFYLDKSGAICYIKQITEGVDSSKVCMVLGTEVGDKGLGVNGSLTANLLFMDGSTEIVNVTKVSVMEGNRLVAKVIRDKADITDKTRQISTVDARNELTKNSKDDEALTKFFTYRKTTSGYELTELNATNYPRSWEDPDHRFATGSNTVVASVKKEGKFAKNPIKAGDTTTTPLDGWDITANNSTTFVVGKQSTTDNEITYSVYKGRSAVPEMDASKLTAICENVDTAHPEKVNAVARFVYLETAQFKDDVPEGYVFVASNNWDPDPTLEDTYVVDAVDVDGTRISMRVDANLRDAISNDKMVISDYDKNTYVGKFCEVLAIDENGVVSDLKPVAGLKNVADLGGGVLKLTDGDSVDYDDETKFVYVDMGWSDSETNANSKTNIREVIDDMKLDDAGTFRPDSFFNIGDVDATVKTDTDNNNEQSSASGVAYKSVMAVAVIPYNDTNADFIYVVRTLW